MKIRLLVDPPENVFADEMVGNIIRAFQNDGYQVTRAQAYLIWLMNNKPLFDQLSNIDNLVGWQEKDEDEFL